MALSFSIPLGLLFVLAGGILFFATRNKKTAYLLIGVGLAIASLTLIGVLLAVNSQM